MSFEKTLRTSITYYEEHSEQLHDLLDELIGTVAASATGDPAKDFAVVVAAMERDHDKAISAAAMALLRLAKVRT